ncbi:YybS family protein [Aquibacillus koreensis]|nr:YybS family protein [Aquibacillus koreensis]
MDSKVVKEGIILAVVYIILLFLTLILPGSELITFFLLPIPFIIFTSRYEWKYSIIFIVLTLLLSMFISVLSLPIGIMAAIGGVMIGFAIKQNLSPYETWARGTVGFVLGLLFVFISIQGLFQVNLFEELKQMIDESLEMSNQMMKDFGFNPSVDVSEQIKQQMYDILNLIPYIMVMIAMVIGFLSQWVSYKVLNKLEKRKLSFPPFKRFALPKMMIWIYFFAYLFTMFSMQPDSMLYISVINIFHLVGFLLVLQGFSFIFFFAEKKGIPKAVPIIVMIFSFIIPVIGLYIIRILGIIDLGFSLKERLNNTK